MVGVGEELDIAANDKACRTVAGGCSASLHNLPSGAVEPIDRGSVRVSTARDNLVTLRHPRLGGRRYVSFVAVVGGCCGVDRSSNPNTAPPASPPLTTTGGTATRTPAPAAPHPTAPAATSTPQERTAIDSPPPAAVLFVLDRYTGLFLWTAIQQGIYETSDPTSPSRRRAAAPSRYGFV